MCVCVTALIIIRTLLFIDFAFRQCQRPLPNRPHYSSILHSRTRSLLHSFLQLESPPVTSFITPYFTGTITANIVISRRLLRLPALLPPRGRQANHHSRRRHSSAGAMHRSLQPPYIFSPQPSSINLAFNYGRKR